MLTFPDERRLLDVTSPLVGWLESSSRALMPATHATVGRRDLAVQSCWRRLPVTCVGIVLRSFGNCAVGRSKIKI